MNNEDILKKDKHVLSNIKEIQEHHAFLLNQHFKSVHLETQLDNLHDTTAFPTPNHLYKQNINNSVKKQIPPEPSQK